MEGEVLVSGVYKKYSLQICGRAQDVEEFMFIPEWGIFIYESPTNILYIKYNMYDIFI